jgi:SAM-dependent methyltransferase
VSLTQVVDLDPKASSLAIQAGHRYFCGRIEDFRAEERYDLILMLNLIEHVPNPRGVLREIRKLLSPRGRICIKTPNFRALDARIFRHTNWGGYHCPRHFVLFSRTSVESLIASVDLCVLSFSYTQGAPFWSVSVFDLLRRLGLVEASSARPAIYHPFMPFLQAGAAALDFVRKPFAPLSQMIVVAGHKENPTRVDGAQSVLVPPKAIRRNSPFGRTTESRYAAALVSAPTSPARSEGCAFWNYGSLRAVCGSMIGMPSRMGNARAAASLISSCRSES